DWRCWATEGHAASTAANATTAAAMLRVALFTSPPEKCTTLGPFREKKGPDERGPNPTEDPLTASFQLAQLLLHDLGLQRNEHAFIGDHLLSLLAEHELEELLYLGRQRFARRLVDVDVDVAAERILVRVDVFDVGLVARSSFLRRELEHFHVRCDVGHQRIGEPSGMSGHVLGCHRESVREAFALDELDVVLVLASVHRHYLEVLLDAVDRLEPVEMNRAAGPIALGAQVAPGPDVLVAELARLRVDRVELRQAQAVDRVILVDEDDARCGLAERSDAAGRDANRRRFVAVLVD